MSNPKCHCIPYLSVLKIVIVSLRLLKGAGWDCRWFKVCWGRQLLPFCHEFFISLSSRFLLRQSSLASWFGSWLLAIRPRQYRQRFFLFGFSFCWFLPIGETAVLRFELLVPLLWERRLELPQPNHFALPAPVVSCHKGSEFLLRVSSPWSGEYQSELQLRGRAELVGLEKRLTPSFPCPLNHTLSWGVPSWWGCTCVLGLSVLGICQI